MKIIYKDGHVDECPQDQELHVIRHTAAHIMAQAIKRLYPQADFAFGPATENGFYYDVDLGDQKLSDEDLANIEKEMRKIVKENLPIKPFILPRAEAVKLMEERKENYKIEHMADLADETEFSFFQQLHGLGAGQDEGLDGQVLLDDLAHLFFDVGQILVAQLLVAQIDIVVEAVLGGRAEGKISLRIQALDGLCHNVSSGVTDNVQLLILRALVHMTVLVDDLHSRFSFDNVVLNKNKKRFTP